MRIDKFVKGDPYPKHKATGDIEAPDRWSQAIVEQTAHLRKVRGPCRLEVEFVLPQDRFPADRPFGTDLDNLLKILMDSLKKTVEDMRNELSAAGSAQGGVPDQMG